MATHPPLAQRKAGLMGLDRRKRHYLDAMDVPLYVRKDGPAVTEVVDDSGPAVVESPAPEPGGDWDALAAAVAGCRKCSLCESRTNTVFGVGDRQASWMVIGEAPGADEDRQGEPFVGRGGRLLTSMLEAAGAPRESVFIANILKCRPPENRDPKPDEVESCSAYLAAQIDMIQPRLIIAVGRIAAQNLLKTDTPIGKLRGQVHSYGDAGIPLVATYHPAYLLRSPGQKRRAWEDMKLALSVVAPDGRAA